MEHSHGSVFLLYSDEKSRMMKLVLLCRLNVKEIKMNRVQSTLRFGRRGAELFISRG